LLAQLMMLLWRVSSQYRHTNSNDSYVLSIPSRPRTTCILWRRLCPSRGSSPFEPPQVLWSVHKLTCSWNASKAGDRSVIFKAYEHFSYRPEAIKRGTFTLTLSTCNAACARLHLLTYVRRADLPSHRRRHILDLFASSRSKSSMLCITWKQ
jgi:hypothetical protein